MRFRNRAIGEPELKWLREAIAGSGWRTLTELSRIVCAAWDWRQANGAPSECACRDLLLRLEQWGHLDPGRFRATCYRAANWIHVGDSAGRSKRGDRYFAHGHRKAVFLYELHPRARQLLAAPPPSR